MPISDTKPEIQAMQDRIIMSMTGEQRLKAALEVCQLSRAFVRAGIKKDHPDWSQTDLDREFIRLLFFPGKPPAGF